MPFYEFNCQECGGFPVWRGVSQRDQPEQCPECGELAKRAITAPNLRLLEPHHRRAQAINERSSHEPTVACSGGASTSPKQPKRKCAAPSGRPWMIGH